MSVRALELEVVSSEPLRFTLPFGEGSDRHDGVRAASSITRLGDGWLVAQDDSNFAAVWDAQGIRPVRLFPRGDGDTFSGAQGNKAKKPDLECGLTLGLDGEVAVFLGSGSTPARRRAVVVRRAEDGSFGTSVVALDALYALCEARLELAPGLLNIEGACVAGEVVRLFQRGNAEPRVNATVDVSLAAMREALQNEALLRDEHILSARRYDLGALDGSPLGFSAADGLPDGRVLFAASAEASPNTYDDGACAGSVLGVLGPDGAIEALGAVQAREPLKIEGLAIERTTAGAVDALCVCDADDPAVPSVCLRVRVRLET